MAVVRWSAQASSRRSPGQPLEDCSTIERIAPRDRGIPNGPPGGHDHAAIHPLLALPSEGRQPPLDQAMSGVHVVRSVRTTGRRHPGWFRDVSANAPRGSALKPLIFRESPCDGLTGAIADLRGANDPRITPESGRALFPGARTKGSCTLHINACLHSSNRPRLTTKDESCPSVLPTSRGATPPHRQAAWRGIGSAGCARSDPWTLEQYPCG
jgi:hypothetical protein